MPPDPKEIVSVYNQVLLGARRHGFLVGQQAQRRITGALEQTLARIESEWMAGRLAGSALERAQTMKRQAFVVLGRLETDFMQLTKIGQSATIDGITRIHHDAAVNLAKAYGTDAGLMAARFADVNTRALAVLASRGSNAANFRSLAKYHLDDAVRSVDRIIDAGVASGMSPAEIAKQLRAVLAKQAAVIEGLDTASTIGLRTIAYDARRIAVTEVNNALREANRQNLMASGIVRAARWQLSGRHAGLPSSPDRCDDLANAPGVDGEPGYYSVEDWPLAPHPFCGCTQGGPVLFRPPSQWNVRKRQPVVAPPKPPPPPPPLPPVKPPATKTVRKRAARKTAVAPDPVARRRALTDLDTFTAPQTVEEAQEQLQAVMGANTMVQVPGKETGMAAYRAPRLGKVIAKKDQVKHLADVNRTLHDLRRRFPTLPQNQLGNFYVRNPESKGALGLAYTGDVATPAMGGGMSIWPGYSEAELYVLGFKRKAWLEGKLSQRFGVSDTSVDPKGSVIRHELGHRLTVPGIQAKWDAAWNAAKARQATRRPDQPPGSWTVDRGQWFTRTISEYSSTKKVEEIAEAFAMFTEPEYVRGTLPVEFERVLFEMLGATPEMIDAEFPLP